MLWRVTSSPYALAASGTLTLAFTISNRFIVGISSLKNIWIFHPGFLYGENAGELKNKAFSGFGGGSEGENCKNAIGVQIMGQVHVYDRVVETMAANPTGQFFSI